MVTALSPPSFVADQAAPTVRSRRLRGVVVATAALAGAIGVLGIMGWSSGASTVAFVPRAVSIAPFVAVAVLLLALSLVWLVTAPPRRSITLAVGVVAAALLVVTILTLIQQATGLPVAVEGRLLRLAQRVMSGWLDARSTPPLAAACVALLSLAVLLFASDTGRCYAGIAASVAAAVGAIVCLGYAYAAPLFLHDYPRLVALPGGAAFLLLGTATVVAAGPDDLPLSLVAGSSARAILLRRFLPVTIGALLVTHWFATRLLAGMNPALTSMLTALLVSCCVAAVVVPLACAAGAKLDLALVAARNSEKHFRDFVEHATIGMFRATPDGRLLLANPALGRMLGYDTVETLAERNLKDAGFEPGRDRTEFREEIGRTGEVAGLESEWTRADGSKVPVRESARVVRDGSGEVLYYEGTVEDISKRKRAEEVSSRLRAELECRVIERTTELAASNSELEAFAYSVSHDLRAPLRGINGFSQALLEDCADRLDDAGRGYLARIQAATRRMGQLIDDLLGLSRVARSEMKREPVDLSAVAAEVVADLQRRDPGRRVEVVIAPGLVARGDPSLLRLVMGNLLGNAWKFTARRESARIEVGGATAEGLATFFVSDDGAGFDMTYAHKLFAPFQRLHDVAEFEGTGIGLALVRRVVQRHGGWVRAEGAVGRGATLTFTLG